MNAIGYMVLRKHQFLGSLVCFRAKLAKHVIPTFEINGHGASVWGQGNAMHIRYQNLINLANHERNWIHGDEKTSVFRHFGMFSCCKNCKTYYPIFEINGYGASV